MVLSAPADLDGATPFRASVRSLLRPVLVGLVLTLLLVAARGGIAASLQQQIALAVTVEHDLGRAYEAMLDKETGLRGWLLTGEDRFLEPYRSGEQALQQANDALLSAIVSLDSPELARAVKEVWTAQDRWLFEWAAPVLERRASGPDVVLPPGGKERFDRYRVELREANALATERIERLQDLDRTVLFGGISLQILTLLLCGGITLRQRRRLQVSVVHPVEGLLAAVHRIGAGEYTTALPVDGPRELRALAEALAQMAVSLQRAEEERVTREAQRSEQVALATQVLDLSHEFTARLDVPHVLDALVTGFAELSGAAHVAVWLLDGPELTVARETGQGGGVRPFGEGMVGRAGVHGTVFLEADGVVRRADDGIPTAAALALPMVGGGRTQAVIELRGAEHDGLELGIRLAAYRTLAAQGGLALAAARLHQRTVELGRIDALTGVSNRRTFDEDVSAELALAQRNDRPLTVALLDVDRFKLVNDTYGHLAGDDVLREVARLLAVELRDSDSVYRYGGEEFVVLLRDTDGAGGLEVAERLRASIEAGTAHHTPSVTISCGVAALSRTRTTASALIEAADEALYLSKVQGRNQVRLAADAAAGHAALAPAAP